MEHTVVGALREAQEVVRPVVLSCDHDTLAAVRGIEPTWMTGCLLQWPLEDAVDLAIRAGARQLAPQGDQVTPELVTAARHNNLQVVTWTINAPAEINARICAGALMVQVTTCRLLRRAAVTSSGVTWSPCGASCRAPARIARSTASSRGH